MALWPLVLVDALVTKSGFALPSYQTENGFLVPADCFVGPAATKHSRPFTPGRREKPARGSSGDWNLSWEGREPVALAGVLPAR